jgi:hypothetical protein
MPFKLIGYLLKHAATGLALSSTAVIGFAYLMMVPGSDLNLASKFIVATQQLMQISHLLLPLILLIGLSFGLGLLHNHSEIVPITQLQPVRVSLAVILFVSMATMVMTERLLWPQFEPNQPNTEQSSWQFLDHSYSQPGEQVIKVSQGHIVGYLSTQQTFGVSISNIEQVLNAPIKQANAHWLVPPASVKNQYIWWQQWHQALWPAPLFLFLWVVINRRTRGSNAASLTGSVAGIAITSGLLAEAMNIILNKALVAPWMTMVVPLFAVTALTLLLIWRNK